MSDLVCNGYGNDKEEFSFNNDTINIKYKLRQLKDIEKGELSKLLYEAIFQKDGEEKLPKNIINKPELAMYIDNWGKEGDICVVAVENHKILGAAWSRVWNNENKGFGYIDNNIPELAIAVYKNYRNIGIGRKMLNKLIKLNKEKGYEYISLSVSRENFAVKLYQQIGFQVVKQHEDELIMKLSLKK